MTAKKAEKGNWDDDFAPKENSYDDKADKLPYVKFDGDGDYKFRLIGGHVKYMKWWKPYVGITHDDYKSEDPAWQAGFYPNTRFAIHVIDRADGKLKILDKGKSIFEVFGNFRKVNDINPAGKEAPDFIITVSVPKKNGHPDPRNTKYSVQAQMKASPLTEEELAYYKESKVSLEDLYRTTPLEKLKEMWETLSDDEKIAPKRDYDNGDSTKEKKVPKSDVVKEPDTQISDNASDQIFDDDNATSTEDSSDLF